MSTSTAIDRQAPRESRVASRDQVLDLLRNHEATMRALGVRKQFLFGSAARDELGQDSDIDVFIDYDFDGSFTFVQWTDLEELLRRVLGRNVDESPSSSC